MTLLSLGRCSESCSGFSPAGRWVLAMPPHTGTGTTSAHLMQPEQAVSLNVTQCVQNHGTCAPADASIVLMYVANPFRRVLSDAAYRGVINGSRRMTNDNQEATLQRFRKWVLWLHYVSPGVVGCCARGQRIPLQTQFARSYKCAGGTGCRLWLGRTAALGADMGQMLRDLGYAHHEGEVAFTSTHCGASCPSAGHFSDFSGKLTGGGGYYNASFADVSARGTEKLKTVPWFDANATALVTRLFAEDFDAYGWSRDPADMWQLPMKLRPGFQRRASQ